MSQPYRVTDIGLCWAGDLDPSHALPPSSEMVTTCRRWIQAYASPRKTFNTLYSSYSLKHMVENTPGYSYVTNGAFIQAALELGYEMKPVGRRNYNALFKMGPAARLKRGAHSWAAAPEGKAAR
jgi:hypothetical protein